MSWDLLILFVLENTLLKWIERIYLQEPLNISLAW